MPPDLYELLKEDHSNVKDLLEKAADEGTAEDFLKIKKELDVHMQGEEEYFYPELKKEDPVMIIEGYYEHKLAKKVIKDLDNEKNESDEWNARMKVLKEMIEHHIEEEEEDIFKLSKEKLDKKKEIEIKDQIIDLKKKNDLM